MLSYFNPGELNAIMAKEDRLVLIACLRKNASHTQREVLEYVSALYKEKLKICLSDADGLKLMAERFDIHGTPSFVLCFKGKKRDILLGHAANEDMKGFIQKNLERLQLAEMNLQTPAATTDRSYQT